MRASIITMLMPASRKGEKKLKLLWQFYFSLLHSRTLRGAAEAPQGKRTVFKSTESSSSAVTTKKKEIMKKAPQPRNKPHGSATAASILGQGTVKIRKNGEVKVKQE